jgi:hypothetical protein
MTNKEINSKEEITNSTVNIDNLKNDQETTIQSNEFIATTAKPKARSLRVSKSQVQKEEIHEDIQDVEAENEIITKEKIKKMKDSDKEKTKKKVKSKKDKQKEKENEKKRKAKKREKAKKQKAKDKAKAKKKEKAKKKSKSKKKK